MLLIVLINFLSKIYSFIHATFLVPFAIPRQISDPMITRCKCLYLRHHSVHRLKGRWSATLGLALMKLTAPSTKRWQYSFLCFICFFVLSYTPVELLDILWFSLVCSEIAKKVKTHLKLSDGRICNVSQPLLCRILLCITEIRGSQPGVHEPQRSICLSKGVHLRIAIENKNIFTYYLFPNINTYISQSYFHKSLYAYC